MIDALNDVPLSAVPIGRLRESAGPRAWERLTDAQARAGELLAGRVVWSISSTAIGGGVAEMLRTILPYTRAGGVDARWLVVRGSADFFRVTKRIHNFLHGHLGDNGLLGEAERSSYELVLNDTSRVLRDLIRPADVVILHDPQTLGLALGLKRLGATVVWRCHIGTNELGGLSEAAWDFLWPYAQEPDVVVFSRRASVPSRLPRQSVRLIAPSIDPFSDKNRELSESEIETVLRKVGITNDKPIVTQVSRFDRLKDPIGVLNAWKAARQRVDCQLILVGGGAPDDPEGAAVLKELRDAAGDDPDVHILDLPPTSNVEINAIQRASSVIIQKSLKEGFGLTVSEALWKGKPLIAGAVGGIPLQVTHRYSGILVHTVEGTAFWIKQLLSAPDFAARLGKNGREHVRNNFLLTRHMRDYMLAFIYLKHLNESVIQL